ncbi:hypothetical protein HELRODRAFT_164024 [Helobdella robusta]|uniref:Uncharacterized protein n=1 Tax=Helobdella robusta TaxID=6412 RepID=T1EUS6_HELRO|nr:hypothetical protein HELRODRAFT_164024 [Helobdella robusta]ESN94225.1 hypothetical protein HELRODRAFT_164024 [Helobdella robusta]
MMYFMYSYWLPVLAGVGRKIVPFIYSRTCGFKLSHYFLYSAKKSKRGGGVGVFIKHDIKYVVSDNSAFDDENVDVLCVDIESEHASSRANVENYKKFRNYFTSVKRKAEKNYFQQKFEEAKSCSKQKWEIINGIMNRKQNILEINKLKVDDKIIEDPEEISILFSEYFINVTEKRSITIVSLE